MTRRRTRLAVTPLEDRLTPVLGGVIGAVPFVADTDDSFGTTNLLGIVDITGPTGTPKGVGSLLDRGTGVDGSRHVLTAARVNAAVGDLVTFYLRNPTGTLRPISIPVSNVFVSPLFNPMTNSGDLAVLTLSAVAPFGVPDYAIYTNQQAQVVTEVGKPFFMAGYGLTGTGTSGPATLDLQTMRITATGGSFFLVNTTVNGTQVTQTRGNTVLRFNATAAQIQNALAADFGITAQVSSPSPGFFEILFTAPATNHRQLGFQSNPVDPLTNGASVGQVTFRTLTNGQFDGEFQRLTFGATGGTYRLGVNGVFTGPITYTADPVAHAAAIQAALVPLFGPAEITVTPVTGGVNAGSFQVSFDWVPPNGAPVNVPQLVADTSNLVGRSGPGSGTISILTSQDGGRRALRVGANEYDALGGANDLLISDFDNDGTDSFYGPGDVGAPGFLDVGGGVLALASIYSTGTGGFTTGGVTTQQTHTRVSPFTNTIRSAADTAPYTATVDLQFQAAGNDGLPDVIRVSRVGSRIEVRVRSGTGPEQLYYADAAANMSSLVIRGTSDPETTIVEGTLGVVLTFEGQGGTDTLVGPNIATAFTVNGTNAGTARTAAGNDIVFTAVENLTGGTQNDTFNFVGGGSVSGNVDGGAGFELLDFTGSASTTINLTGPGAIDGLNGVIASRNPIGGQFLNINGVIGSQSGTADTLNGFNAPGVWTVDTPLGVYTDSGTGKSLQFGNFEVLNGGAGNDVFNVRNTSGAIRLNGGAGDDVFNVASDAPTNAGAVGTLGGTVTVNGGAGADRVAVNGRATNDAFLLRMTAADGTGALLGLSQQVQFAAVEGFTVDGRGGSNSFTFHDNSNGTYGSPSSPETGIVYTPTGATSGAIRVGGTVQYGFTNINAGLEVSGDGNGSGDADTLTVLGTSRPGLQSQYGEAEIGDGRDRFTVADTFITIESFTAGPLLPVAPGLTGGAPTFSTIYVATGNETGEGDDITATPSNRVNLLIDGMGPTRRPGDRVTLLTSGPIEVTQGTDPPHTRVTQTDDGASVGLIGIEQSPVPVVGPSTGLVAVGTDVGVETRVQVYDRLTGAFRYQVTPYPGFIGGVSVASGDFNGDGIADLLVGTGPGGGPRVGIFDGVTGAQLADFFGYEEDFRGGVYVAAADMNQDGVSDVILGTGPGGGPRVRILDGVTLEPLRDAFAYEPNFRGGVTVAAGDVNADGTPDVVTSAGAGGGPRVVVLDGNTFAQIGSFFVFDPNSRDGFYIGAGDVTGDGFADVIAGAGAGGPARVRVFAGPRYNPVSDFFLNDPFDPGQFPQIAVDVGVRVAAADVNGDGIEDVLTGKGPGSPPILRAFQIGAVNPVTNALSLTLQEVRRQDVFEPEYGFGIFVGGSD